LLLKFIHNQLIMKRSILAGCISTLGLYVFLACNNKTVKEQSQPTQQSVPVVKSVFVNGDSLHYIDIGKGEPVVFIHGTLNDYRVWQMQLDTFSKNYRVIAYSRRYAFPNNQAYNDSADYSPVIHAKDLAEFIKSLNLGAVHLVGHSYGAYTALLTTMNDPELVRSLTLGEPPVMPLLQNVTGGDTIIRKFMDRSIIPAGEALRAGNNERGIALFVGGVIGDTSFFSNLPPEARRVMLSNVLELRGATLMKNRFPPISCDDLKKIQTPILLLTGERTTQLFNTVTNELDKCLKNKERATIPAAGHGLEFENPVDFNKIVLAFIDKH
jgi:pimeloyl-ACP methyl ester carboxylesterase